MLVCVLNDFRTTLQLHGWMPIKINDHLFTTVYYYYYYYYHHHHHVRLAVNAAIRADYFRSEEVLNTKIKMTFCVS